ncbi:Glycosyltransferase involved in cell wall bisynthesis [Fibrobacter sp. UWB15]|uniref:glycosyltransferase n=1 Tax=unclassified Fibrobacter TaxID=2634177 RepID=UPI00090F65BC|nr:MULTISPECIES: glycosyltransferase [unclassified Fibrobacter]PWJ63844.1 glycosyltransferase involved in cell wall biosynthesis [Fibrobacter sp. UWB6]SHG25944.1 Glycosyltransferase involved in cell wall bisynthesis [Fibrobacter sp. UWB8]SMG34790.1 Glycosyltransferase involved in cell wall bisynthesis [Fibrobacter sp. UWB15]
MNLLFNLVAVQPIHSAKFHGGGSYGEVIFWALVKRGVQFSCAYDSRKYLDPMILDACKTQNIPLFDINEKTPQQIIDENQIDSFYTPLYSLEKKWDINVKDFVFTWHGVRALEMQYSWAGVGFAKKLGQKFEALVRYRESWKKYFYKPKYQALAARMAEGKARTITVSEHSRASIKSFFPELLDLEIPVFYSPMTAYEPEGFLPPGVAAKKYFLLTSGARWEKNNLRAAKAFDELVGMYQSQGKPFDFKMVITGAANPKAYLRHLKHKDRFVLLGYVENRELEFLHQNAYAFVFPSLNEGFGYPPVQSMRYGVPVAASGTTSIPEICGDAVLYFDPYSVSEIKNRLVQLLDSKIFDEYAARAPKRYLEVHTRQIADLEEAVNFILKV